MIHVTHKGESSEQRIDPSQRFSSLALSRLCGHFGPIARRNHNNTCARIVSTRDDFTIGMQQRNLRDATDLWHRKAPSASQDNTGQLFRATDHARSHLASVGILPS